MKNRDLKTCTTWDLYNIKNKTFFRFKYKCWLNDWMPFVEHWTQAPSVGWMLSKTGFDLKVKAVCKLDVVDV